MRTIDAQDVIDRKKLSALQWTVFALGCLIILSDGLDTGAIGYIAPSVMDDWGIERKDLGPVLSAALIGMSLGALVAGPLADRFGRKWIVVLTTAFFGVTTLLSASSTTLAQLEGWRFLTGLGLGAAMPNIATLVAEYMPRKRRALMVNLLFCAFPLGASLGGVLSAVLIKVFGWHSVLIVGGILPMVIAVLLVFMLPESVQFLLKTDRREKAGRIVCRISGNPEDTAARLVLPAAEQPVSHSGKRPAALIFSGSRALPTLMMWLCCFMSLLVFYLLVSWMPTILKGAGLTLEQYSLITAVFPFGGVAGTAVIGWLMDRFGANKALMWAYVVSAVLVGFTGVFSQNLYLLSAFIFLAGAGLVGAQSSLPSLAAIYYPVQCRAVGVSWMHGIGRLGAISGAFFGGLIFAMNLGIQGMFMVLAVPVLISAVALHMKSRLQKKEEHPAAPLQDTASQS